MNARRFAPLALAPLVLAACGGHKKDVSKVSSPDSVAVSVVTSVLGGRPYQDWATFSADLRGLEDAVLVTTASGVLRSVAEVGSSARAGQGLCDIESERYKAQLDAAAAQVELAQGEVDRARKNVEAGSLGKVSLDAAQAQLLGARTQFLNARKQYEDSRCQAPFAGVVASRSVERWQTVGAGTPTLRLVRKDRLEVVFAIPESEAAGLKPGMEAEFFLLDRPEEAVPGKITAIDLAADAKDRVLTARAVVPNADGSLRPGAVGKVRVLRADLKDAVVVPSASLLRRESGVVAMVDVGGKAHEVPVVLGSARGDSVLVRSGLKPGDKLIIEGAFRVSEGTKVGK